MTSHTIAVLGAGGTMGLGMSRNIHKAGLTVKAWNRSRDKVAPLAQDGIAIVDSPAEAADGADVVITILSDGDAVLDTASQFVPALTGDAIWLQMSTIGHQATERCIDKANEAGVSFFDAPVLGTKKPAEEGKLVVLASGPEDQRHRVDPIFEAVGQRTVWVGEAGKGSRLKVAVNVWIVALVEGAAETLALAEGLGLDPKLVLETVSGGPLDLPYLQMKGTMMLEDNFEPSFKLSLAAKDAALARAAAAESGIDLPLVDTIAERLAAGSDEHGDKDMAATYLTTRERSTAAR
jgi:3-hydroxyisobutyrate dehydrogenase